MRTVIELNKILSIQKQLNMDSRKNEMIITNDFQEAALRVEERVGYKSKLPMTQSKICTD